MPISCHFQALLVLSLSHVRSAIARTGFYLYLYLYFLHPQKSAFYLYLYLYFLHPQKSADFIEWSSDIPFSNRNVCRVSLLCYWMCMHACWQTWKKIWCSWSEKQACLLVYADFTYLMIVTCWWLSVVIWCNLTLAVIYCLQGHLSSLSPWTKFLFFFFLFSIFFLYFFLSFDQRLLSDLASVSGRVRCCKLPRWVRGL